MNECSSQPVVGSRVSLGRFGRGTVIRSTVKKSVKGLEYDSIVVKFDGDRYDLGHRGMSMLAREPKLLKDNATIRFGSYYNGRGENSVIEKRGDIIEYRGNQYQFKGGIYNGKVHREYYVPDIQTPWHSLGFDNGIWINLGDPEITIIKRFDPYKGREGDSPDSIETILEDIQEDSKFRCHRQKLENLCNETFG